MTIKAGDKVRFITERPDHLAHYHPGVLTVLHLETVHGEERAEVSYPGHDSWPNDGDLTQTVSLHDIELVCAAQQAVEGNSNPAKAAVEAIASDDWFHSHLADGSISEQVLGNAPPDVKAEIADEAKRIVSGARRAAYGKPEQNFERIARFWDAYFANRGIALVDKNGDVCSITAADVSPMMRLMKEARLCETPDHRDSFVDLVGYTLTGAEVNGVKVSS